MNFLPGAPLTAGSGAFIFVPQTGFAGIILLLIVSPIPLLPSHRKNLYLEQSPQIRPSEKQKTPDYAVKQQFVLEEKHDFSHSPIYIVGE